MHTALWRDGALAAVIDWEDAALGDPISDLAATRQELLWKHGEQAMEDFTRLYLDAAGADATDLPWWELHVSTAAAVHMDRWGLDPDYLAHMHRLTRRFMDRAAEAVAQRL